MMSTPSLPQFGDLIADKYRIDRQLGRGGMGVVYAVTHHVTGKQLALKCLLPEYLEHPELVERFLREAQAAGRIEHRHIVDVFDAGRDGTVLYIVMALLEGKPLTALLQDETLTLEETLGILVRAMDGVAAAHALGIVHRDLKPDNIFVCVGPSGRLDDPRVLDFGISKLEDDTAHALTQSGMMMGTPYYMSFEQLNSQRDLDQRVDVYSIGVILYEALAGQLPYLADSASSLAIRMLTQPAPHLSELRPELPSELCAVVMRAIARDRDERFQTMTDLIEAIRPFAPLGAGSLVTEGQGTPLRSSRLSKLQAFANSPTETPLPAGQMLQHTHRVARPELRVGPEQEVPRRHTSSVSGGMTVVFVAILVASGGLVWWFVRPATAAQHGQTAGQTQGSPSSPVSGPAGAPIPNGHSLLVAPDASGPEHEAMRDPKHPRRRRPNGQASDPWLLLPGLKTEDTGVAIVSKSDAAVVAPLPHQDVGKTSHSKPEPSPRAADAGSGGFPSDDSTP